MPFSEKCHKLINSVLNNRISEEKNKSFDLLYDLIVETNEKLNITTITDELPFALKHVIDSISVFEAEKSVHGISGKKICDVGCGGGFPGLPMAICDDSIDITMIDSTEKKINALSVNAEKLKLKNVHPISGRGEELCYLTNYREKFDLCVSRAVARLNILSELCLPFVKKDGYFIALKGQKTLEELDECKKTFSALGAKLIECRKIEIGSIDTSDFNDEEIREIEEYLSSERYLVIVKKITETKSNYPRNWAQIKKKPL